MAPPDESTAAPAGAPQPGGRRRARALFVRSSPAAALLPLLWLPVVNAYQPAWALVGLFGYGALAWLAVVEASIADHEDNMIAHGSCTYSIPPR